MSNKVGTLLTVRGGVCVVELLWVGGTIVLRRVGTVTYIVAEASTVVADNGGGIG